MHPDYSNTDLKASTKQFSLRGLSKNCLKLNLLSNVKMEIESQKEDLLKGCKVHDVCWRIRNVQKSLKSYVVSILVEHVEEDHVLMGKLAHCILILLLSS